MKITIQQLLVQLKQRVLDTNRGRTALERGAQIRTYFPQLADRTIQLANEAMNGMLVLPGTGPDLYFVGSPTKWESNPVNDNEYTFHLNRMPHLKTLAEAYSLTGDLDYAGKAIEELDHWISTVICPPITDEGGRYRLHAFQGLGTWRALEVGIRGYRTWPLIIELLSDTPFFTPEFLEKLIRCVELHCRVLYEVSPLLWPKADHNHYLMENLGLLSLSCLFPEMEDAPAYLAHAQAELDRCMEVQCTPCGGQIEGCPSYHNGCVFWFAMRLYFSRRFGLDVPDAYVSRLNKMFVHSVHATRSCGGSFPWGDSHTCKETMSLAAVSCYMAYGTPDYLETALYFYPDTTVLEDIRDNLWRIPDVSQLKQIFHTASLNPKQPVLPLTAWQKDLDQAYVRSGWDRDALSFMTGCRSPIQNLHAHIDAGGFDFTAYGEPLVSDPGIYTYRDDENRRNFKSAFRHNCLTINWRNMWEYRGAWAYGPQKEGHILSVESSDRLVSVVSKHYNYAPAVATRLISMADRRFLVILDRAEGVAAGDSVQLHFHLNKTIWEKTELGLCTAAYDRPNAELAYIGYMDQSPCSLRELTEVGKISTGNDVWHDSLLLHLDYQMPRPGCFIHATVILPHRAGKNPDFCRSLTLVPQEDRLLLTCQVGDHVYEFLWSGNTLALNHIRQQHSCMKPEMPEG